MPEMPESSYKLATGAVGSWLVKSDGAEYPTISNFKGCTGFSKCCMENEALLKSQSQESVRLTFKLFGSTASESTGNPGCSQA
jgi:hypothetical protein